MYEKVYEPFRFGRFIRDLDEAGRGKVIPLVEGVSLVREAGHDIPDTPWLPRGYAYETAAGWIYYTGMQVWVIKRRE